jgi:hypothetical protein
VVRGDLWPRTVTRALELSAAKAYLGHGETGAGAVGIIRALLRLDQASRQAIPSLHHMNPHVQGVFDSILKERHMAGETTPE